MSKPWFVKSLRKETRVLKSGDFGEFIRITYILGDDIEDEVLIPVEKFNPAIVAELISQKAKVLAEVASLRGEV